MPQRPSELKPGVILYAGAGRRRERRNAIAPLLGQSAAAPRGILLFVVGGLLLLVVVLGVLTIVAARPAAAHASLIASDPPAGVTLDAAPSQVALTFSEQVEQQFARVTVTDPEGQRVDNGEIAVAGEQVDVPLESLKRSGTYRVAYRVASADSHPIEGEYTFAVALDQAAGSPATRSPSTAEPARSEPSPAATEPDTAPAAAQTARGSGPIWLLSVGVALAAAAVAYLLRRRRNQSARA
jgi:copper resistance protein C